MSTLDLALCESDVLTSEPCPGTTSMTVLIPPPGTREEPIIVCGECVVKLIDHHGCEYRL